MWAITRDVVHGTVCLYISVCWSHDCEPCKNGRTDRNVIWRMIHKCAWNHVLGGLPVEWEDRFCTGSRNVMSQPRWRPPYFYFRSRTGSLTLLAPPGEYDWMIQHWSLYATSQTSVPLTVLTAQKLKMKTKLNSTDLTYHANMCQTTAIIVTSIIIITWKLAQK